MSTQKQNTGEVILHLFFFCVNRCERERERDDAIFVDTNNDTNDAKEETTTTIFLVVREEEEEEEEEEEDSLVGDLRFGRR